jgi:hypothetical protein
VVYVHTGRYEPGESTINSQLGSPLATRAILDNRELNTFIPGNCGVCHGGAVYEVRGDGNPSNPANPRGMVGARFLPFDLQNSFSYYSLSGLSRSAQESTFRTLNQIVARTDLWDLKDASGHFPVRQVMNLWYGASSTNR